MTEPIRPTDATAAAPAALPALRFVHLKVHSAYSLLEGAMTVGKLAKFAAEMQMPAIGLTDTNNMFGVLEFSDKLAKDGIQPIAGISLAVDFPTEGQVLHFKKVKANAHLELTTGKPETWVRWRYLAVALALAGVLLALRRWWEKRGRGRVAGAA